MRVDNIKVEFKIPIKPNEPDLNGIVYSEEAIIKSLDSYKNSPVIISDCNGGIPVGVIDKAFISWSEQPYVICNGYLMFGGTECNIIKSHKDESGVVVIDEFEIVGVGISR